MSAESTDRDLTSLAPIFKVGFEAWLQSARGHVPHVEFRVTETRRSLGRQQWLYAQGREIPYLNSPRVTWTINSRHRWGLAADVAMIRKSTGEAIWEISSWQWLYRVVPVEPYGLVHLGPREWVHLEYRFSDEAIRDADILDLRQT